MEERFVIVIPLYGAVDWEGMKNLQGHKPNFVTASNAKTQWYEFSSYCAPRYYIDTAQLTLSIKDERQQTNRQHHVTTSQRRTTHHFTFNRWWK
eukprot:scaffold120548_cov36-Cyclotella_meneghiniana.AAC.1